MFLHFLSVLGLVPTFQKTKCKRLLNTTMERIKLLEKRRQARVRQLHRDVIELLQRGKEHKVQPWLERIWKELCLFSVYIKIAEYCQFVQSNLKDIAGQRECPSGLEEPIAGLCFAASCCAELPELQELREIFAMKYGKKFVNSAQEVQPSCHINQQFLECLCAKEPSETRKQALLEEITTQYNAKQGHDTLSIEGFVDANECNQLQGIDETNMEALDEIESEEVKEVDVVHESNHIETGLGTKELTNEPANRKRTLEDRDTRCSALIKRAYSRRKFCTAPQRPPPPPPPPKRAPPPLPPPPPTQPLPLPPPPPKRAPPPPPTLQVLSMPNFRNDKQVIASSSLPLSCSTMANSYFLETYGSHVHPRLPKYEDLVADFTARKH